MIGPTGQGLGDGIEDVLVACPENDVRAHAGRSLGDPADGERGVPLAAAERLAAGSGQVRRPSYPGRSSEPEMEQLRGCLTPGQCLCRGAVQPLLVIHQADQWPFGGHL